MQITEFFIDCLLLAFFSPEDQFLFTHFNTSALPFIFVCAPSPFLSCQKLDRKSSTSTGSLDSGGEPKERSLKGESALQKVLAIPGNVCCCDCGQPEPRWASINLGITLCIQCSGIHRYKAIFSSANPYNSSLIIAVSNFLHKDEAKHNKGLKENIKFLSNQLLIA